MRKLPGRLGIACIQRLRSIWPDQPPIRERTSVMLPKTGVYLSLVLAIGGGSLIAGKSVSGPVRSGRPAAELPAVSLVRPGRKAPSPILFDDFNYSSHAQMSRHGWIIRTAPGWPGVAGARLGGAGVLFLRGSAERGKRLGRIVSSYDWGWAE